MLGYFVLINAFNFITTHTEMGQFYKQSSSLYFDATLCEVQMDAIWKSKIVVMIFKISCIYEISDNRWLSMMLKLLYITHITNLFRAHVIFKQFIYFNFRKCLMQKERKMLKIRFRHLQKGWNIFLLHITSQKSLKVR